MNQQLLMEFQSLTSPQEPPSDLPMAALAVQAPLDRPLVAVAAPADLQQQRHRTKLRGVEEEKRERCVVSREFYQDAKADGWIGK